MAEQNIFVSYSRSDADFVVKLATDLKESGANLWLDQLDITYGDIWDVEIEKALQACTCLLFIVSKSSVSSNNVLNEVYYALEDSKRVLPVKINDCKIPFRIKRLHYVDLSSNYENGFLQLLKTLNLETKPEATPVKGSDDEEQTWEIAKSGNSKYSIEKYLDRFPEGKFKKEALVIIDKITNNEIEEENRKTEQLLWTDAVSNNTIPSYQNYLSNTELAAHVDEANSAIEKLRKKIEEDSEDMLWQRAEKENTINEYENYFKYHPSGKYARLAKTKITSLENSNEEALWNEAKSSNTVSSFQHYIKNTKVKKYEKEASLSIEHIAQEESVWKKVKEENTASAFREYLKTYKNGMHIDEALLAIKTLEQEESKIHSFIQPSNPRVPVQPLVTDVVETDEAKQTGQQWFQIKKESKINKTPILLIISVAFIAVLLVLYFLNKNEDPSSIFQATSDTSMEVTPATSLDAIKNDIDTSVVVTTGDSLKRTKTKLKADDEAIAYNNQGGSKYYEDDYAGAIKDYTAAIELKQDYADAYVNRGTAKYALNDFAGAIKDYTAAIKLKSDHALAYRYRGNSRLRQGDYNGAISDATKAIQLKPDIADAHNELGNAKAGLKDYAGAIKDYTKAIQIEPNYSIVYYNRGLSKQENGDKTEACIDFKKACDLGYIGGCNEYKSNCK